MGSTNSIQAGLLWACLLLAVCCSGAAGEAKRNLLEDGASFEAGLDGFNLNIQYLFSHRGQEIVPVFDASTAVHGQYSLRLDNPLHDKIYLTFRPFRLTQQTSVTFSGYLKGAGKAKVQLMRWPWESAADHEVALTEQWQRFSFPALIKNDQVYFLWILPGVETGKIWIDALQLEEGELTEFHPKPLELGLATTAERNTYSVGEDCVLEARLYAENPPATIPVSIKVLDIFSNEVLGKTFDAATQGQKHVTVRIPLFKAAERGSYKVLAEAKLGAAVEREILNLGVLKRVERPDPFFGFQVKHIFNDDSERRFSEGNEGRELVYSNADPRYIDRLIRLAGAFSIRDFRAAEWRKLQDQEKGFVFRDEWLDLLKADDLGQPLLILNAVPPKWADNIPVGDVKRYEHQKKDPKVIPSIESWKNYVRTYVTRYREKTPYYEVVNEPETIFPTPEKYVEYLKAAYEVIRETDPQARIVAPSYSGRKPLPWIEGFVKAGGHKYTDIWAIHYAGRTFPEQGMDEKSHTWEVIQAYRDILVKANDGQDKPLWNTEGGSFYWIEEYEHWPIPEQPAQSAEHWQVRNESLAAAYAARLQLIEKASGVDRLYSFEFGYYYSQNASKARDLRSRYVNYDGSPAPALVAYNTVAELFAGTKKVALLPLEQHVVAVVFERAGKTIAGLWKGAPIGEWSGFEKYDPPVNVDLPLAPGKLAWVNMLGRPFEPPAQGAGVRVAAGAFPFYFTSALPPSEVAEALKQAVLSPGPRPNIGTDAESLIKDKYYSAAIALLEDKVAADPANAAAIAQMGGCYRELKQFERARASFEKALAANPALPEAHAGMGNLLHDMAGSGAMNWSEGLKQATPYLAKAVADRPNDLELRFHYWYCLSSVGDPALALEQIDAAERLYSQSRSYMLQRMKDSRAELESRVKKAAARKNP